MSSSLGMSSNQPLLGGMNGQSDLMAVLETSPGANLILTNMLRTGNPILDILVAMMLPFLFRFLFGRVMRVYDLFHQYFFAKKLQGVERIIEYETTQSIYGYSVEGDFSTNGRNEILQKAISMYIGTIKAEEVRMFKQARISLLAFRENAKFDYDTRQQKYGTTSDQLGQYKIAHAPVWNEWMQIAPDLHFFQSRKSPGSGPNDGPNSGDSSSESKDKQFQTVRVEFRLLSTLRTGGEEHISKFLQEAFHWYVSQMKQTEIGARFFYTPIIEDALSAAASSKDGGGGNNKKAKKPFKRYKLSEEKGFGSLFFPGKKRLLNLLDHFSHKTGKYQISGFPHKLGLMFYGPPGSGKTSTIKAIANYMKRSIVNIPLSRIRTNQQLMDLIFDGVYDIPGEDIPVKLGLTDVIFVIEDIDCSSRIVNSRKKKKVVKIEGEEKGDTEISPVALERSTSDDVGSSNDDEIKRMLVTLLQKQAASAIPVIGADGKKTEAFEYEIPDALNLSGILNAIDGVVDSPGRIIIITTNHPDRLDEALIRPGRIDQVIHLGYIKFEQAVEMLQHYYGKPEGLSPDILSRLRICFPTDSAKGIPRTPADIECKCAECDTIEEFIECLENDNGTSRTSFQKW